MEIHKTNQEIFKNPKTLHMRVEKPRCSRQFQTEINWYARTGKYVRINRRSASEDEFKLLKKPVVFQIIENLYEDPVVGQCTKWNSEEKIKTLKDIEEGC